jgi:KaiC/GvpD/RAD55 family RecA-like ATPase
VNAALQMNTKPRQIADRLLPHSEGAEQGLLGCVLLQPGILGKAREMVDREYFYDLRHRTVWEMACQLEAEGGWNSVILFQRLADHGKLEACGGLMYVSGLTDATPSAENWEYYVTELNTKFLARRALATAVGIEQLVWEKNGIDEASLTRIERGMEEFKALSNRRVGITPQNLKKPGDFGEEFFHQWLKIKEELPGYQIPFPFPYRVRDSEVTLITADSGSGKSTFLSQTLVCLMNQMPAGHKVCLASFEMPAPVSLWLMSRQLLGMGPRMEESEESRKTLLNALAWLDARMWIYDFVGIEDWRTLLDVFQYAREKEGCTVFAMDSIMRIGIPEDDLATQSLAASRFAAFVTGRGQTGHMFQVHHTNKSKEGNVKQKTTGSKRWSDNANNLLEFRRNEDKAMKIEEAHEKIRTAQTEAEKKEQLEKIEGQKFNWDAKLLLHKQRYPGAPQNGSKFLYFDWPSLQFRHRFQDGPVRYL